MQQMLLKQISFLFRSNKCTKQLSFFSWLLAGSTFCLARLVSLLDAHGYWLRDHLQTSRVRLGFLKESGFFSVGVHTAS